MKKSELAAFVASLEEKLMLLEEEVTKVRRENAQVSHSALWKSNVAVVKQAAELEEKLSEVKEKKATWAALDKNVAEFGEAIERLQERVTELEQGPKLDTDVIEGRMSKLRNQIVEKPERMDDKTLDEQFCATCGAPL